MFTPHELIEKLIPLEQHRVRHQLGGQRSYDDQ
jgi:hypothetical protein